MNVAAIIAALMRFLHTTDQDVVSDYILDHRPDIYAKLNPAPTPEPTPFVSYRGRFEP